MNSYNSGVAEIDICPPHPDETAEAYVLERLTKSEAAEFEEHYILCARCATVVQETALYLDAMKAAAAKFDARPRTTGAAG